MLIDLRDEQCTGKDLEARLDSVHITANKNTVPGETRSPFVTSGVRLGTPAVTTRGMGVAEKMCIRDRAYGMKPKRGNRGTPGCSRYLCKIVAEAIRAELPGLGKVGYVANSTHTVVGNCCSAGRLYDKIGNTATAKVKYCLLYTSRCV